jgi:5'-nucleotidase
MAAPTATEPIHLTIMGTNDTHGWLEPKVTLLASGQAFEWGGAAILSGYVKAVRAANPGGVLLLDAGDLFQGTLVANVTEGRAVIDAFNALGYTAAAIGNHEFDYGPEGPAPIATRPGEDPFGALRARLAQAKFPILSRNIYDAATGKRPAWLGNEGMLVTEAKGVKVGIFGLTTPQTPFTTNPVNVASLRFGALVPDAAAAAQALRARGAELVVVVAHAGGKCAKVTPPDDLSTCDQEHGEIFQMLNALPPGTVDAVVAGHVHTRLGHYVKGVPVISTFGMGKSFGLIDLFLDPRTHRVQRSEIRAQVPLCLHVDAQGSCDPLEVKDHPSAQAQPVVFLGQAVKEDPAMQAVLAPHLEQVRAAGRRELGVTVPRVLLRNYEAESALADVMTDALREADHADVAVMNSGGFRADLPAGPLTYGRVYEVLPFDNTVATLQLTGEELRRLLDAAYAARKGVYQVSGLRVTLARCPGSGRLQSLKLENGRPLEADHNYRVVMPDFLARGGDGLMAFMSKLPPDRVDLGTERPQNLRDTLVELLQRKRKTLTAPKANRIVFVDDGRTCGPVGAAPLTASGPAGSRAP